MKHNPHVILSHHPLLVFGVLAHSNNRAGRTMSVHAFSQLLHMRLLITSLSIKQIIIILLAPIAIVTLAHTIYFMLPRSTTYAYAADTCIANPTLLPSLVSQSNNNLSYQAELKPRLSVGTFVLYSDQTCMESNIIPEENSRTTIQLKAGFIAKSIEIHASNLPTMQPKNLSEPIAQNDQLLFELDQEDKTFSYQLVVQQKKAACFVDSKTIHCPIDQFTLTQGSTYDYVLERIRNTLTAKTSTGSFTLLDPVAIIASSVAQSEKIYPKPTEIILTSNKPLEDSVKASLNTTSGELVPIEVRAIDTMLTISLPNELVRGASYTLTIQEATATDGATLPEPHIIVFSTSTGPTVLSSSLGSYKTALDQQVTLDFDSPLDTTENLQAYVELLINGSASPIRVTTLGSQLFITPSNTLPRCALMQVRIKDTIPSIYGVRGGSTWSKNSQTICQQQFTVGASVQGRNIEAFSFGNGSKKIVFIGGMHGNEKSSTYTLTAWVDELERNAQKIPSDKTIIVIPNHNPDGFVANTRVNSRGVDLNRNFPSNDWVTGVYIPPSIFLPTGGGSEPLSEPEALLLADYIIQTSPTLVLTYHATARVVVSNGSGNSQSLAEIYAAKSGFSAMTSDEEDSIFGYPTTGEFETWLHDKHALPTLLIELATQSTNEIQKQSPAMWAMITN